MRYEISLELENEKIIQDYRRKCMSLLKALTEDYNPNFKEKQYGENKIKDFTFAMNLPFEKVEGNFIKLKSRSIKMYLSIYKMEDALYFMTAFLDGVGKTFKFGENNSIKILSIRPLNEKEIRGESVIFNLISGLVIREHIKEKNKDWYYLITDEKGIDILKTNLKFSLKDRFKQSDLEAIEIEALNTKKTVVKFYDYKFPITLGNIRVTAKKEILEYFYKSGLGSRASSGFGMCEIID